MAVFILMTTWRGRQLLRTASGERLELMPFIESLSMSMPTGCRHLGLPQRRPQRAFPTLCSTT